MKNDLPFAHLLILILLFFIAVNLFVLDLKVFYPQQSLISGFKAEDVPQAKGTVPEMGTVPAFTGNQCPVGCLDLINLATSSSRIGETSQMPQEPAPIIVKTDREYFIPLGSGQTSESDWDNLVGTETVINPSVYGSFKTAYFIASLKNPTRNGAVEVRIYNVTDNNVLYGSHLVMNGLLEQTITSQNFAMPGASKLYRVQLKSTLSYPVSLENARLKIIAQ